jgi:hypothetical protein
MLAEKNLYRKEKALTELSPSSIDLCRVQYRHATTCLAQFCFLMGEVGRS